MADDTEKSGDITPQKAAGREVDVSEHAGTDIHFGDLDVDNIYVLPAIDSPVPSASGAEYMLGEEGQELPASAADVASLSLENPELTEEVGAFMEGLSEESDYDLMVDVTPASIPVLHTASPVEAGFSELALEGSRPLVDLDQLFDAVGATYHQSPFGEAPEHQVSLEDTFWDNSQQEQSATPIPDLFEAVAALDPSRALDNIFETLYTADES